MLGPALGDHGFDTSLAQRATMSGGVVAAIGVDDAVLPKRSATNAANGWNRINERQQLRDVVGVRASQDHNERNAVGVYEDVVLGTGSRAIRGVRASFSLAPTARTDDESTAAYDRSIWPAARNLSSSNSCSWSHTPAFCQSFNRRRQVAPEPKPRRVGKRFQRIPVLNTNRMPLRAARPDTRGRPGSLFARSFAGGSNGSISIHGSSSTIGASILGLPLFRCPRLIARRGSKQPLSEVFELAS